MGDTLLLIAVLIVWTAEFIFFYRTSMKKYITIYTTTSYICILSGFQRNVVKSDKSFLSCLPKYINL